MSLLYYENLEKNLPAKAIQAIMSSSFDGIKPYLDYIDRITHLAKKQIIEISVQKIGLDELLIEESTLSKEVENVINITEKNYKQLLKNKRISGQLKEIIKLVNRDQGVLYQLCS